jgi:molybdopterin-containing oxidoreductase family iron-sulfur binding subunit
MAEMSRRMLLKLTAAGGAAAAADVGLKTVHQLLPYVTPPEQIVPGEWTLLATTCRECPAGCGMHLRVADSRPVKAEGNPDHPVNRGGLCPRGQSAVAGLYDPDRLRQPAFCRRGGHSGLLAGKKNWQNALEKVAEALAKARRCVLVGDLQTGALGEIMQAFARAFGAGNAIFHEPLGLPAMRAANAQAYGQAILPQFDLSQCDLIVSFAADFLETYLSPVEMAWQFAQMRAYDAAGKSVRVAGVPPASGAGKMPATLGNTMGRMIYIGPRMGMTAMNADEYLPVAPTDLPRTALALLKEVTGRADLPEVGEIPGLPQGKLRELAELFRRSRSLALPGPTGAEDPGAMQTALACAYLNQAAGQIGAVDFARPHALSNAAIAADVKNAMADLGKDDVLIVHNLNLAYLQPGLAEKIKQAGTVVYLGLLPDETAELADWVLPIDSPLESWGDHEPYAGLHCPMQPTIGRLHDTRPAGDILLTLAELAGKALSRRTGQEVEDFRHWLNQRWEEIAARAGGGENADEFWQSAMRKGFVLEEAPPAASQPEIASPTSATSTATATIDLSNLPPRPGGLQVWLWPTIMLHDGRTANRGWLQEAPEPSTTLVWGCAFEMHPATAAAMGFSDTDILELSLSDGKKLQSPLRVTDLMAENTLALSLGQGHWATGLAHAHGKGVNGFALSANAGMAGGAGTIKLSRTGQQYQPTYSSFTMQQHGRDLAQWVKLSELERLGPGEGEEMDMPLPEGYRPDKDLYSPHEHKNHRWAMVVDLHRCIGCGACSVACQAENNVAVVGPEAYRQGREMAWLKIVPYRSEGSTGVSPVNTKDTAGTAVLPRLGFLPVLCQQCDAAPCEPVCPVYASVHNEEGINAQVYNRCIGTRYCSNNCPYKVRRFNWLNYTWRKPLDMQLNPDVSVRQRGVMEKCTFCIQRVKEAEIAAKRQRRPVRDGEIQPACLQSCPTGVFAFGDLKDPASRVSQLVAQDPRRYQLLRELSTKPAVIYLKRIER